MSLRFVSPGAIACACEAIREPASIAGALLLAAAGIAALTDWPRTAALVAALSACCTGVSIGALLVERRFR
jgi:hypothetical protein